VSGRAAAETAVAKIEEKRKERMMVVELYNEVEKSLWMTMIIMAIRTTYV
jgi:hypothetical protein